MRRFVTVEAPAKLNLGLQVLPKRSDGFHEIKSIFTTVNLCDELKVSLHSEKNCCKVYCRGMNLPAENTFTKAYKAFCVLTGIEDGVLVDVTKRIPSGGGLGGGSSDSSSFIKSIDYLFRTHLNDSDLMDISAQVGSDVFFFTQALIELDNGKRKHGDAFAAVVGGRGEEIRPVVSRNDFAVLLVFPGVSVSTAEAYKLVDETMKAQDPAEGFCLEQMYRKPVREWAFVNDFTIPVAARYSKIGQALEALKASGADFVDMSGSGSTVFGVFETNAQAIKAQKNLSGNFESVLVQAR